MIIDSHAHLVYDNLQTDEIINNMEKDGLDKIITIGTCVSDSKKSVELSNQNENIYCTVGLHPEYADEIKEEDFVVIEELAKNPKVVAIGEIGLDYHYTKENKEKQKDVFIKQIKIAKKLGLPVCIHSRDAKEDMYEILNKFKNEIVFPSVMHCFSEDNEFAQKFMDLGFYLSFAGNITYKKTDTSFIKNLDIKKILLETDCPFLSPEPLRGRINQPKNVHITALKIADEFGMDVKELEKQVLENTYRVYKKLKRD